MNQARRAIDEFCARPWASLCLAVLVLAIGALFVSGLLPKSQKYVAGHEWYMGAVCFAGAAFFTYCCLRGIRQRYSKS
jgi:Na+/melibiose symporter-like transporter